MYCSTSNYEFAWGKKPKGFRAWVFELCARAQPPVLHFVRPAMNYGAAKKLAIVEAKMIGAQFIKVGS